MNKPAELFVSVIVPVFNDRGTLEICLNALKQQKYPKNSYEIIVVDNGQNNKIKGLVNGSQNLTIIKEDIPGSYAARNKGISVAKGDIIAFTDSDCIPSLDWIGNGVKHLLSVPHCGLVGGKIDIFFKKPGRPRAIELYDKTIGMGQKFYIERFRFSMTANLFTFKRVFEEVGFFDNVLKSGGDLDWGRRVFLCGYTQLYADDVIVAHPARYSLAELFSKSNRLVGGEYLLSKKLKYHF